MGKAILISGLALGLFTAPLPAQQTADDPGEPNTVLSDGLKTREQPEGLGITIPRGTRVPLVLINSISTKHASPGDRVYLQSVYPVPVDGGLYQINVLLPDDTLPGEVEVMIEVDGVVSQPGLTIAVDP